MSRAIPTKLIQSLRDELASAISDYKAYEVPGVCARLGLAEGSEEEAFQSKYKYASSRLAAVEVEPLVKMARSLLQEIDAFNLLELVDKIADLERPEITSITRRRLVKLLTVGPLVSEVDDFTFVAAVFPLENMSAPHRNDNRTLEEYLIQHTIRNDDLTQQEYLEALGLLTCSTRLLFSFIEQLTSAEYQSEERQRILSGKVDDLLRHDGYTLSEAGRISGSPIFEVNPLPEGNPADIEITATLSTFNPDQIGERWQSALDSRSKDAERAITLARTLLEDVCKWILHEAGESWEEKDDLPVLYKKLSKTLRLAPDDYTEQVFKQILSGSQSVVTALGALRNKLGDAHSIGPKRIKPAARHAELAVNLSGTMATFLVSTWNARQAEK
ncbi:abortive infection family protein [Ruegeria arenilitoris]|uniref:abortive infection family protein n=1 Tax=Ruegeria arenilitoris TaxID=1173585 RepID=UPI001CFD215C|nr:abortive infection family protein [Ruegeria arenilitoris]